MKLIYLVRHGESDANVGTVRRGSDALLTERGMREAAYLADRSKTLAIEAIISSTYARAKQTAEVISRVIGLPVEESPLFEERKFPSVLKGIQHADSLNRQINAEIRANFHKSGWRHSDEENFDDLKERARTALSFF